MLATDHKQRRLQQLCEAATHLVIKC